MGKRRKVEFQEKVTERWHEFESCIAASVRGKGGRILEPRLNAHKRGNTLLRCHVTAFEHTRSPPNTRNHL